MSPASSGEAAARAAIEQRDKLVATLRARAALVGIEVVQLDDGTLLASKWGWSRLFPTLTEAAVWLDILGVPR
jgi:hypothetical protein